MVRYWNFNLIRLKSAAFGWPDQDWPDEPCCSSEPHCCSANEIPDSDEGHSSWFKSPKSFFLCDWAIEMNSHLGASVAKRHYVPTNRRRLELLARGACSLHCLHLNRFNRQKTSENLFNLRTILYSFEFKCPTLVKLIVEDRRSSSSLGSR